MRTKLIRVLLVLAIIFVVAVPVLRVIFGQTERQWERETLQRFGICPDLIWILCAVLGVTFVVLRFRSRDRRDR
jgi:hypothetical protein